MSQHNRTFNFPPSGIQCYNYGYRAVSHKLHKNVMMRYVSFLICAIVLTGCASGPPKVQPGEQFAQKGAVVSAPSDSGWLLLEHTEESIAIARPYPEQESVVLNTYYFWIGETVSDDVFFEKLIEGRKQVGDEKRFNQLDVSYQNTTFQEQSCLKYEGVAEYQQNTDKLPAGSAYFTNRGYICRSKLDNASAILMEISMRSASSEMPEQTIALGERFFSNIRLTETQ